MPTAKIGIAGGGQLGKMMILEAKRLGLYVTTLDPDPSCPSRSISDGFIEADLFDKTALRELAEKSDIITYEWENISADALLELEGEGHKIYPSASSLRLIQDKFLQKTALREAGVSVPDFQAIPDFEHLKNFAEKHGYPIMLKKRRGGYDGYGNYLIQNETDITTGFTALGGIDGALMAEEYIDFLMEVSVIAVRGQNGDKAVYPTAHNIHKNNILITTAVPAQLPNTSLQQDISDAAAKVMDVFEGVGTFGIEMFIGKNNLIYINEVAPRPHNSGHYTIEGCRTNQFENHIRAILALPLGEPSLLHNAVFMRNLLGRSDGAAVVHGAAEAYGHAGVNLHIYGKSESRTGRKMGHYTITAKSMELALKIDKIIINTVKIQGEKNK